MLPCYRNNSWMILVFGIAGVAHAMSSVRDGDVMITKKMGNPCFSFPADTETKKRSYSLGQLVVWDEVLNQQAWGIEIQYPYPEPAALPRPNSQESCVEYGKEISGTTTKKRSLPLGDNAPYSVALNLFTPETSARYERKYLSKFCLSHNAADQMIILRADYNKVAKKYDCVKREDEHRRESWWNRLFGSCLDRLFGRHSN